MRRKKWSQGFVALNNQLIAFGTHLSSFCICQNTGCSRVTAASNVTLTCILKAIATYKASYKEMKRGDPHRVGY
jgi:hypothetical protein